MNGSHTVHTIQAAIGKNPCYTQTSWLYLL